MVQGVEIIDGLQVVKYPSNFHFIWNNLTREARQPMITSQVVPGSMTIHVVDGFNDVLGEAVGEGYFYNHSGSVWQLVMALSVSTNPEIVEIIRARKGNPRSIIKVFRENQVLSGQSVLDLGSGVIPSFALAAKKMDAIAYTADIQRPRKEIREQLDGHIVVNLNRKNSSEEIAATTGRDFDLVSENIIGLVVGQDRNITMPTVETLHMLATPLLKTGGYYHSNSVGCNLLQKI